MNADTSQRKEIEYLAGIVRSTSASLLKDGKSLVNLGTPTSIAGTQSLNSVERILYMSDNVEAIAVFYSGASAYANNRMNFNKENYRDGANGNAFQHADWNMSMTAVIGYDSAKKWANAHEYGAEGNVGSLSFEMDMFNNEYGRQLYLKYELMWDSEYFRCSMQLLKEISDGNLRHIENASLVPTNGDGRRFPFIIG